MVTSARDYIRERPLITLGVALAAGYPDRASRAVSDSAIGAPARSGDSPSSLAAAVGTTFRLRPRAGRRCGGPGRGRGTRRAPDDDCAGRHCRVRRGAGRPRGSRSSGRDRDREWSSADSPAQRPPAQSHWSARSALPGSCAPAARARPARAVRAIEAAVARRRVRRRHRAVRRRRQRGPASRAEVA